MSQTWFYVVTHFLDYNAMKIVGITKVAFVSHFKAEFPKNGNEVPHLYSFHALHIYKPKPYSVPLQSYDDVYHGGTVHFKGSKKQQQQQRNFQICSVLNG